jgi:RNA polymerase sigma-70 factor, ECF subfamily
VKLPDPAGLVTDFTCLNAPPKIIDIESWASSIESGLDKNARWRRFCSESIRSVDAESLMPTQEQWEQWLRANGPRLLLFARQQTRSEADAQDIMQDAITESWNRCGTSSPPPLAVVFTTIRRRSIDQARREDRRIRRELAAQVEPAEAWFDPTIETQEIAGLIQAALAQLPQAQREVIILKIWGGLTFEEIGATLDIPANTAASRYRYALTELRQRTKEVFT